MSLQTTDLGNIICPFCGTCGEDSIVLFGGLYSCGECGMEFDEKGNSPEEDFDAVDDGDIYGGEFEYWHDQFGEE